MIVDQEGVVVSPGYKKRVKAVTKSIQLLKEMQLQVPVAGPFAGRPGVQIDRTDAVELARFLLGMGKEQP